MARFYQDKEGDPDILRNRIVAVLGYGSQGRSQALNLRDSGINVLVAQRSGSIHHECAVRDGFSPITLAQAVGKADVLSFLLPDPVMPELFTQEIAPHLRPGQALLFAHGFNIHYHKLAPPPDVDVILVAPKGIGHQVRVLYAQGAGVVCLVGVHQNATNQALDVALAYARGLGAGRSAIIETTFAEETETDLFGEQTILCGGLCELIRAGFDTLVEAGYQPEVAYFECLHEVKLIADLVYARGIAGMRRAISQTALYGDLTRGKRIIDDRTRREMQAILDEIRSGAFAEELAREATAGRPVIRRRTEEDAAHLIETTGSELRKRMPWIDQGD